MRAATAKNKLESKQGIPHYRLHVDVDFNALLAHRSSLNSPGATVSINDLLVRATALSLMRHTALNSQLVGDEVLRYRQADICVAVATDSGLIAPIVRGAEIKTAVQIGAELKELAARARNGSLSREQITGGTFTISADHRVVDGATAAGFLATLKSLIESPGSL